MYCRGICVYLLVVYCVMCHWYSHCILSRYLCVFTFPVNINHFWAFQLMIIRLFQIYVYFTPTRILRLSLVRIFSPIPARLASNVKLKKKEGEASVCVSVCVWCKCCRFGVNYSAGRRLCWHPSSRVLIGWGGLEDLWRHGYSWRLLTADAWKYIMTLRGEGSVDWLVEATWRVWWRHYFFPYAKYFYSYLLGN